MHKPYQKGECAQAWLVNFVNGTPSDATTVTIKITDPAGSVAVNGAAMTKQTTGDYIYNYDIPSNAAAGGYTVEVVVNTNGHVNKEFSTFRVK